MFFYTSGGFFDFPFLRFSELSGTLEIGYKFFFYKFLHFWVGFGFLHFAVPFLGLLLADVVLPDEVFSLQVSTPFFGVKTALPFPLPVCDTLSGSQGLTPSLDSRQVLQSVASSI